MWSKSLPRAHLRALPRPDSALRSASHNIANAVNRIKDGSLNLLLDAIPLSGRLQIRDRAEPQNGKEQPR
jgi:hypothetical protein